MIIKIKNPHDYSTVSGTVTVTATATSPIASMQFWLDGVHLGALQTSHPYHVNWNTTTATNGEHKLQALAQTSAGQLFTSDWLHVTVAQAIPVPIPPPDTTAPTVTVTAPAEGATVRGTVSLTATASDAVGVVGVQFRVNSVDVGVEDFSSPYSTSWNTIALPDGVYVITAVARDAAGNRRTSAGVTVTLLQTAVPAADVISPTVALTAPANGATVSGAVSVTATASDNLAVSNVQFQVDGTNIGPPDTSSPFGVTWTTTFVPDGSHVLRAIAVDAAGNSTTSATRTVTTNNSPAADVTAPTVSITSPLTGATVEGIITIAATAADAVGVVGVQFQVNGVNQGAEDFSAPYTTSWNTIAVANGSYALTAIARDAAGNTRTSSTVTVTVNQDSTLPTVRLTSPLGSIVSGTVTVTAAATDNIAVAGVQFYVNGAVLHAEDTSAPFSVSWDTTAIPNGNYTLSAQARDAAGNVAVDARTVTVSNGVTTDVFTADQITYVGAIRMPISGTDTTFAYGGLTGRTVAGQVRLFLCSNHTTGDHVIEIADPGSGYTTDYTVAPRATLVTAWGDLYHNKRVSWNTDGTDRSITPYASGLYWNEDTQLLYWTYNDSYNVGGFPDWGLGASSLDNPGTGASTAYGPWRVKATDGDGAVHYGPWRCLYLWASPFDGSMMCGSSIQAGNISAPWGPDAYGGLAWPTAGTPSGFGQPDLTIPDRYLDYYFMGSNTSANYINPDGSVHGALRSFRRTSDLALYETGGIQFLRCNQALTGGVGSWSELDSTAGGIWITGTHRRGVFFVGSLVGAVSQSPSNPLAAHEWYATSLNNYTCSHGILSTQGITGPVTTNAFPALMIYNPDDLVAVRDGLTVDYTVNPASVINLEATYGMRVAEVDVNGGGKSAGGFYFDPVRNYLFVLARLSDISRVGTSFRESLIHVFHLADTA